MAKANRIVDGKRNANVPVDMSDHFYDHGNEYCRYLITDPRCDASRRKKSQKEPQGARRPNPTGLVLHRKRNKLGIVLRKSEIQHDFYFVMTEGSLEEWHISNIDEQF